LRFAKESVDDKAIWGAVLEKAWAKVRGNYVRASGDTVDNSISVMTGVPVFSYKSSTITTVESLNFHYNILRSAEVAHYAIGC
jgi:hypothetical protein